MSLFDLLPAGHHASATSNLDVTPHSVEILVVDCADVAGMGRKNGEIVAAECVVVVRHCVRETPDHSFRYSCTELA